MKNVEKMDIYPKGLKDSTKEMINDDSIDNKRKRFLEPQSFSMLCEQNAKVKKSTEKSIPPIKVTMEVRKSREMIIR